MEILRVPPGGGEEVGEDAVDLGVQREPDVAALDLDGVDVRAQARLPVDNPVRARVDGRRRYARHRGEVAHEAQLDRCRMSIPKDVVKMRGPNPRHRQRMDVEWIAQRRAERDHLLDELWLAMREHLREDSAPTVADNRDARTGPALQLLQRIDQRPE